MEASKAAVRTTLIQLIILFGAVMCATTASLDASAQGVVSFDPPGRTSWVPDGCRQVPYDDPVVPSRESWRNIHGDAINTDEISRAIAPVIEAEWVAEPATYNLTGPAIDDAGNLYISPYRPYENVVLISIDPSDGSRRWAITGTGAVPGTSAPMVLDEPSAPGEQRVYLALYDRALSVSPDGTIIWDVPTGLSLGSPPTSAGVLGVNYLPGLDAIVALTVDGFVYALDRSTGAQLLTAPFQLPGEASPAAGGSLPPTLVAAAEDEWQTLVNAPDGSFAPFVSGAQGAGREVTNMFSIDPFTGRLWIAATAPDAEDGTVDGVSELGALYGLDIVPDGGSFQVTEACHASFQGGSASTPALRADGSRIYVGDDAGKLLAISAQDCSTIWELDVGQQIVGSVGVSSDDDALFAPSRDFITQVFDEGATGVQGWQAGTAGLFEGFPADYTEFKLSLPSIGANALGFQAAIGPVLSGIPFAVAVGYGTLDRETGAVRSFTVGTEESIAVLTSGADGSLYIGNSPARRPFSIALGLTPGPLSGGITKYAVRRHDLLSRDAVCAASDRATNAFAFRATCPDSAAADVTQIGELISQAEQAGQEAVAQGEISSAAWTAISAEIQSASLALDVSTLNDAATHLENACEALSPAEPVPALGASGFVCLVSGFLAVGSWAVQRRKSIC